MKLNQKYIEIGLVVLILIVGICAFNFGYRPYQEKAEALEGEITQLTERKNALEAKVARTDEFNKVIINADDKIDAVLAKYGPGNTMEKEIMMIVDMVNNSGVEVTNINLSNPSVVFTNVDEKKSTEEESGEDDSDITVYTSKLSLNMQTGYTAFKSVTDFINNHPERMTLDNFSLSFDQATGLLNANLNINLYGVTDKNHKYVDPVVENIEIGNFNLFKSLDVVEEEPVEGEEGTAPTKD